MSDFASTTSDLVRAQSELAEASYRVSRLAAALLEARDAETVAARKVDAAREALTHAVTRTDFSDTGPRTAPPGRVGASAADEGSDSGTWTTRTGVTEPSARESA